MMYKAFGKLDLKMSFISLVGIRLGWKIRIKI